jgi:hypothetical protein
VERIMKNLYREEAAAALAQLDAMRRRLRAFEQRIADLEEENAALRAGRKVAAQSGEFAIGDYPVLRTANRR